MLVLVATTPVWEKGMHIDRAAVSVDKNAVGGGILLEPVGLSVTCVAGLGDITRLPVATIVDCWQRRLAVKVSIVMKRR
jgi:hypothetical protein